jgi:methylthioribose-1-phosphate isomerase
MYIRGAPAIGAVAGFGLALAARNSTAIRRLKKGSQRFWKWNREVQVERSVCRLGGL